MAKILIIDDEEKIRSSLKSALERRDHEIVTAANFDEGSKLSRAPFDLIFLDIQLPDGNGVELLKEIRLLHPNRAVVMISGHGDIETAVTAIKEGAFDFIEKPLSLDRVMITISNAVKTNRLKNEKNRLSTLLYGKFIGESPQIVKLKNDITLSAPKTNRFLILGENGSGKELIAHMIHNRSQNADGPFVAVNCAALPHELVESELFGHIKGAFTGASKNRVGKFAEADGGSIFLDEISEMPIEAQAKILRAIETRQITPIGSEKGKIVSGNIIAASNKNLSDLVKENKFREDLLYRLNVVQFDIPPLRERVDDIPLIADYFLQKFADESGTKSKKLSQDAISLILQYPFPGNVRELKNLIERVNIYCPNDTIESIEIEQYIPHNSQAAVPQGITLKEAVTRFEIDYINRALSQNGGNVSKTAQCLGLERSHLYKKLKKDKNK